MKNFRFYLHMILASLLRRRSRMLVAMLAVAIGSTILCGLLLIYYDVPRQLAREFRSYGANLIILPRDASTEKLDQNLLKDLAEVIPADKTVGKAPYAYRQGKINEQPYMMAATDFEQARANSPYWLVDGTWPQNDREVLLGREVANAIGLSPGDTFQLAVISDEEAARSGGDKKQSKEGNNSSIIDLNQNMTIKDMQVTGIVTTGGAEESLIFMSFATLKILVPDYDGHIDVIECSIEGEGESLQSIVNEINTHFPQVTTRLAQRLTASQDKVLAKLQSLVWIVTIIVLSLTMISVSTTMMAVVAERRKEIGLKKALGASDGSVVKDFLGEGTMLGLAGGAFGSLFGFLFARQVSISVFARSIDFRPVVVPLTIILTAIITVLACLYPVRKTLDIKPAIVLKGE